MYVNPEVLQSAADLIHAALSNGRADYAASTDRGICPVCGRSIQLKKNGTLRDHGREKGTGDRWAKCAGRGQKPKED